MNGFGNREGNVSMVKILAVGDVTGEIGLEMLRHNLWGIREDLEIAFAVVNGENADGTGIKPKQADAILDAGADVITLGNHTYGRREIYAYLDEEERILRPLNYSAKSPGRGVGVYGTDFGDVCVINLIGRYTMDANTDNPFVAIEQALGRISTKIVLVDMHAEVTSERLAMGYNLDGRVSAVWGTHTHVQTSDACVLPGGTGYISDLGMTGPERSVLGMKPENSIARFMGEPPGRYETADGSGKIECAVFGIDENTGRCLSAEYLRIT